MAASGNSTGLDLEQLRPVVQHGRPEEIAAWLRYPLEMALSTANLQLVRCLVSAGANTGPGWKGRDGRSLLDAAASGGNVDAIRIVLERKDAKIDLNTPSGNKGMVPLMRAVGCRHVDAARLLVNVGADVKVCDNDGYTSLHHALLRSLTEVAELLIVAGSDVSARTLKGVTPTLLTMTHVGIGGANLFYILLQRNADVNAVDEDEGSLVHAAVENGKLEYLEALVEAGAKPDTKNRWGNTPLHLAVTFRASVDIVSFLAKHNDVNLNATNNCGNTPLVESIRKYNVDGARALLNAGATVTDAYTEHGRDFPLLYLAKDSVPMTQLLLKRGALSHTGAGLKFGFAALHWAAAEGSPGVLRELCERSEAADGMDVDVRFGVLLKDGRSFRRGTALFLAVLYGPESPRRFKCIVSLLKMSADPNAKDDNGFTPLAVLCWGLFKGGLGWRVRVADLLLRNEADEKLANVDGNTPLDLLKEEEDPDGIMRRLLQNADVDRVWRRRGMLVLCRSWAAKTGKRSGRGKGKSSARKKKRADWVEWLARIEEEDIFRAVVAFL